MRGVPIAAAALAMTAVVSAASLQVSTIPQVSTIAEYTIAMRAVAEAFGVIEDAVPSNVFLLNSVRGDGLAQLVLARRNMVGLQGFFERRGKKDGVSLAADALDAMDALRDELAAATPNQAAAIEATDAVHRACAACHKAYRDGDARTGFRFKPGSI